MKKSRILLLTTINLIIIGLFFSVHHFKKSLIPEKIPNDWFFKQRAFPLGEINYEVYKQALLQAEAQKAESSTRDEAWILGGPANIGGRITDVEMCSTNFDTIYAGAASGGIFKSVNGGFAWSPIFDQALSLSIGDIALDPSDPGVIYVGTGEVNAGGGSMTYDGMGIYKSTDSGDNWIHLGLEETRYIGRIVVDPTDPQRVYAAAMGKLFAPNSERGVYRSTDGGNSWQNVLFVSDTTGCIDLVINPETPSILYAAMWERIRRPDRRNFGGLTCGLYRSIDGGDTWQELSDGLPNNSPDLGRIGISISASDPDIIYAIYADDIGWFAGVYKSTNAGDSWTQTNDSALGNLYSSYGWWFGNIRVSPVDPNVVYVLGLDVYKTTNGGQSWFYGSGNMHVDQHGMYIHPQNANFVAAGNDGGVYTSQNGGSSWIKSPNLPLTQFYTCEVDQQFPQRLYGGTQDNGTLRTMTGSLDDWEWIFYGDGFYVLVDPQNNNYIYAESQYGGLGRSTNGGSSFNSALNGIDSSDRNNWNSPLVFDPSDPMILYFGTQRIYQSVDRAAYWTAISPDLTNGPPSGNMVYGTLTTIAVAPSNGSVIYAGTDDSNVWVTLNGGWQWTNISADLPQRWITRVAVDPDNAYIAYVTMSGYRQDIYLPHIFRTTDAGFTWADISGNLPEAPLNDLIVDSEFDSTLYVASDVGVYMTMNLGDDWQFLGLDLPNVPVVDLRLHNPTRTLIAATYGRSMYSIDLSWITAIEEPDQVEGKLGFKLFPNYPNPFNPETVISFQIPHSAEVNLSIYNDAGQLVETLINRQLQPGRHSLNWDAGSYSSGTYFYKLTAGDYSETGKCTLLK